MPETHPYTDITVEQRGRVAIVRLNRPDTLNAFGGTMVTELSDYVRSLNQGAYDTRAVVITGEGRAFSAGGNVLSFPAARTEVPGSNGSRNGTQPNAAAEARATAPWHPPHARQSVIQTMRDCDVPLVAAINGYAVGAGWSLALGCDVRIAAEDALFQVAQTKRGIVADVGLAYLLPRAVGTQRALELMFTGRRVTAQEALELGVVLETVPPDHLLDRACEVAEAIADGPPLSHAAHKRLVYGIESDDLARVEELTPMYVGKLFVTEDGREGVRSFLDRREPEFTGR
ncbi:MAG: enoyl-CoA hydratase/isomerase family protein [Dehalococcoidia bacterium]|nr:enoyl-CoA hydratase/isomerase family protein [Dehalococcoidia bacterium]